MDKTIPIYLQRLLVNLNITNISQLNDKNYLGIFAKLKTQNPSIGYRHLFDLYSLATNTPYPDEKQQKQLITRYKQLPPIHTPLTSETIDKYLHAAEKLAQTAYENNEIPIGAVIVYNDQIIGRGYNQTIKEQNIMAHAEILAIKDATNFLGNHRLNDCDLYVTIEPCLMCSGAIIHSRIKRVIFGATEPKTGACHSQYQVFTNHYVNHHCEVIGPHDNEYYNQLIRKFFESKA